MRMEQLFEKLRKEAHQDAHVHALQARADANDASKARFKSMQDRVSQLEARIVELEKKVK